ncbi:MULTISPECIES: hypothetical protein [Bacillus cereus group]|uniref:hypothetical protein n=1 Tax=Bacillus cereus group TaxID=86661 RepID=UPI00111613F6|nr:MULTISPECIES: hypothetical protein [Bacillus cereus group]
MDLKCSQCGKYGNHNGICKECFEKILVKNGDNKPKEKCNCGEDAFRKIKFGKSEMYTCKKCLAEFADYLMDIANEDKFERDLERFES